MVDPLKLPALAACELAHIVQLYYFKVEVKNSLLKFLSIRTWVWQIIVSQWSAEQPRAVI